MPSSCSKKDENSNKPKSPAKPNSPASSDSAASSTHALKADEFSTFIANPGTINVVDFSATWCGPCQQLKPVLASIAKEHTDTIRLSVVDIDTEKSLAAEKGVSGIPDVRFYVNGKEVEKFKGAVPKEQIDQIIAGLLKKHAEELKQPATTPTTTTLCR